MQVVPCDCRLSPGDKGTIMTCPCEDYRPPTHHTMRRFVADDWYRCRECGDDIAPGEVCFAHAVVYPTDDDTSTSVSWRLCDCCQDTAQLLQGMGYQWNPGDLSRAWAKAWGKED